MSESLTLTSQIVEVQCVFPSIIGPSPIHTFCIETDEGLQSHTHYNNNIMCIVVLLN